jgi:hydrogenase nickel incorporation protein HypA/HybF
LHEMALAQGILEVALDTAAKHGAAKIGRIKLLVGQMTNAEPEALKFCFGALSAGSIAEGAELDITITPLRGRCKECGHEFTVERFFFVCPLCQSAAIDIVSGRELRVENLEVE